MPKFHMKNEKRAHKMLMKLTPGSKQLVLKDKFHIVLTKQTSLRLLRQNS